MKFLDLDAYLQLEIDPLKKTRASTFADLVGSDYLTFCEYRPQVWLMCSNTVNEMVDRVTMDRDIAGFNEKPVFVLTYCRLSDGTKIHSDPPIFQVGYGNRNGYGYLPFPAGFTHMENCGIPANIRHVTELYLHSHGALDGVELPAILDPK